MTEYQKLRWLYRLFAIGAFACVVLLTLNIMVFKWYNGFLVITSLALESVFIVFLTFT